MLLILDCFTSPLSLMLPPAAAAIAPADALLRELLAVSLTGIIFYTPLYDPAGSGEILDFTFEYLNPVAQRMMRMPEVPTLTHMQQWPHSKEHGTFQFHVEAFETGEPRQYNINYQADGYDNYYCLAARRVGTGLLVSFTDTADQPRSAVEVALREAQAAEKAARADAETQRQRLYQVLMHLPAQVATYHGPDHVYTLVNQRYQNYFPTYILLGRAAREALPELDQQGLFDRLDQVYATGLPAYGQELPVHLGFTGTGQPALIYINAFYLPLRDAQGQVDGVLDFSYNVTEQVQARQLLQGLNQELEVRVQARTQEAEAARAEAEEQRNRLERLFRQAPALINIFSGPEHTLTLVHPGTAQLLQNRPLLGLPRRQALPELPEEQHEPLDRVYQTGEAFHQQERLTRVDRFGNGELHDVYLDLAYQPVFDPDGRIEGVMSFAIDVTERVLARQRAESLQQQVLAAAQRQAQERTAFHAVFEQTPALIALLRAPEHRYEYANPAYQQLFPGRQLVGHELAEVVPELREQGFVAIMDHVYRTGETHFGAEVPFSVAEAAGQTRRTSYYNFTYQAYREDSRIAGITVFAYDVTEQVLARQQREAQRQHLQAVFAQAPVAVCVFQGEDYVLDIVNPPMSEMLGHPLPALVGQPFFDALPELRTQGLAELLATVRRTGTPFVAQEQKIQLARHLPGAPGYFNFVYQPLVDADGRITGIVCVATDVTEQVQARQQVQDLNQELAAINEELQAANEELGDSNQQLTRTNVDLDNFIYTASHDLKAPISNIEGLLYLLQEELPTDVAQAEQVGPTLARMLASVERFKRTIYHLTEVSKLQKEHAPAIAAVSLTAVIEDVRQDLIPLLEATGTKLVVDVDALPPVQFSEKNLHSVVYNLLSNAVKYHSPDRPPRVDVRAHVRTGYTVLEVHDNGLGIAEAHLPRLFTMFQRFHDHVEGSGIGLYMVKRLVENAGGRIEVHSQVGAGTTFFVHLPHMATLVA
jgi:PAS domain S-box-containing protein